MKVYMLVGLPGSGKSTWVQSYVAENYGQKPYTIMNIDSLRERFRALMREIVDEGYEYRRENEDVENFIRFIFSSEIIAKSMDLEKDLFLDNMNLSASSRVPDMQAMLNYAEYFDIDIEFICVYFDIPAEECWKNIERYRKEGDLNNIPRSVFENLMDRLEPPTMAEGYSEIITIKN